MELPEHLSIEQLSGWNLSQVAISDAAISRIENNRKFLNHILHSGKTYYGINTGFGSLCNVRIPEDELEHLQEKLICSHAAGMGNEAPEEIIRLMILLKIHGLSQGYSGVRTRTVQLLSHFYNEGVVPVVYELGSLGASGDLAPLAHIALSLTGRGWVRYKGEKMMTKQALQLANLQPVRLGAKEGLALLNGTQFMSAYLTWSLIKARNLMLWADIISALSADVFLAKDEPYHPSIHRLRPHKGQAEVARRILEILSGSELARQPKEQVQDPYSFRCIPQVHGATADVVDTVTRIVDIEINSVTDNPIVFHDEEEIRSGGNFHGQPLALHADFLAIAMAELGNISERRTYLLISGQRGLPPFLAPDAGLNSGFMIAQYTAASIVSRNKQHCTPSSVDSIVSSNGQEDHVSMGANAVTKLRQVMLNVQRILAIELVTAAQALDLRRPFNSSPVLERVFAELRKHTGFMPVDEIMHEKLEAAENFLQLDAKHFLEPEK